MAHDSPTGLNLERFTTTKPTSRLLGREHGNSSIRGIMLTSDFAARVGESAVQALKREAHFVEVFAHSSS
jgi:hypothetical protein